MGKGVINYLVVSRLKQLHQKKKIKRKLYFNEVKGIDRIKMSFYGKNFLFMTHFLN